MAALIRLNRNAVENRKKMSGSTWKERKYRYFISHLLPLICFFFQHSLCEQPVNSESTQAAWECLSVGLEPKGFYNYIGAKPILHFKDEQSNLKINSSLEKESHMKAKTDLKGSSLPPVSTAAKFPMN